MFGIRKGLTCLYRWKHWGQGREMICPGSHGCCKAQPALELEFPASCSSTKSCYRSGWGPDRLRCQVATGFPSRGAIKGAAESFFTLKHASDDVKKARFKPGQPEGFVWSTAEQAPCKPGFRQYNGRVSDKVEWTKFKPSIHWKGKARWVQVGEGRRKGLGEGWRKGTSGLDFLFSIFLHWGY